MVVLIAVGIACGVSGYYLGVETGFKRGEFEAEVLSTSIATSRTHGVLLLLDQQNISQAHDLLNTHLDTQMFELNGLIRSRLWNGNASKADETLRLALDYRKIHPYQNASGVDVTKTIEEK